MTGPRLPPPRAAAGDELRRRIRNIVAGSGRPAQRIPRRKCPHSEARAKWEALAAEALIDFGFFCKRQRRLQISPLPVQEAIGQIAAGRLEIHYLPVIQTARRIEAIFGNLAAIKIDPWAPPPWRNA